MEKSRVGVLGSCYFIGIMLSIFWVPQVSDSYGRRMPMLLSILMQLVGYVIIITSDSIHSAYVALLMFGMSFPGKHVVFYSYVLE